MPKIKSPGNKFPTDEVRGPNWVGTTDPGFEDAYRNKGGDVGSTTDYVGKKRKPDGIQVVYPAYVIRRGR